VYRCFLLRPTDVAFRWLRRHESGDCPLMADAKPEYNFHQAMHRIADGRVAVSREGTFSTDPDTWPADDARWPRVCGCGHTFADSAARQLFWQTAYADGDGRLWSIHPTELPGVRRAPPGAMWYADWMPYTKGPDGRCLVVRCPRWPDGSGVSDWLPDGPSTTHPAPAWVRTGEPPLVTAQPSIFVSEPDGWHGWLRAGELVGVPGHA
jgi:hypothetical protein